MLFSSVLALIMMMGSVSGYSFRTSSHTCPHTGPHSPPRTPAPSTAPYINGDRRHVTVSRDRHHVTSVT